MSKRRVISQREARRTAKELKVLRSQYGSLTNRYASDYPGRHLLQDIQLGDVSTAVIRTAVKLGCGLAVKLNNNSKIDIYAVKL